MESGHEVGNQPNNPPPSALRLFVCFTVSKSSCDLDTISA